MMTGRRRSETAPELAEPRFCVYCGKPKHSAIQRGATLTAGELLKAQDWLRFLLSLR